MEIKKIVEDAIEEIKPIIAANEFSGMIVLVIEEPGKDEPVAAGIHVPTWVTTENCSIWISHMARTVWHRLQKQNSYTTLRAILVCTEMVMLVAPAMVEEVTLGVIAAEQDKETMFTVPFHIQEGKTVFSDVMKQPAVVGWVNGLYNKVTA